ncbi:hypothetical protein ONZ51_g5434 [Trametes cubensis]|uniref:Protein-S-isoprenylcysteine O-methyltransferase n=1 Tax=Trametes cubensis TaxID=1111947 RepID=A0AAD7TW92_9APHY|nr:hypothetical protein ONZ51_g5434 [Trametes cubensis]
MLPSLDPASSTGLVLLPALKITALLATGYAVDRALSPPNPPPAPKTCIDNRTLFERAIRHVTFCSKMLTWVIVLCDALATLHLAAPTSITLPLASVLLPASLASLPAPSAGSPAALPASSPPSAPTLPVLAYSIVAPPSSIPPTLSTSMSLYPHLTPTALVMIQPHLFLLFGAALALWGAALRVACFRALGPLFTFELTISPTHRLVTDGPYAWVRHPSYAGVYAVLLGASAVMVAPGAWLREAWLAPSLCAASSWAGSIIPAVGAAPALSSTDGMTLTAAELLASRGGAGFCGGDVGVSAVRTVLAWAFVAFWTTKVVYALRSTNRRLGTEDAELRRVFGAQWEEWAGRVPWALVPWVF